MQTEDPQMTIAKLSALTPAEQAVLNEALTGIPAREIAEHLSLSEATVRSHLSSIYVKLGVSGRVALLAQFRSADGATLPVEIPAVTRPGGASVAGWSWGAVAMLEAAYAVYLLSGLLAYGGSRETWLVTIGFAILAVLGVWLAREILRRPSRRILLVSVAIAAGHLLFAVRGIFLSGSAVPFLLLGAIGFAIGWISLRARQAFPPS
jgi:DNA-binding CsgD family transcriptional regulator